MRRVWACVLAGALMLPPFWMNGEAVIQDFNYRRMVEKIALPEHQRTALGGYSFAECDGEQMPEQRVWYSGGLAQIYVRCIGRRSGD